MVIAKHNLASWARCAMALIAGTLAAPAMADDNPSAPRPQGGLSAAEFAELHGRLVKMSTEKVWSVPWHVSVREGRELAARENKPLLLWCTNNGGTNPLGPC